MSGIDGLDTFYGQGYTFSSTNVLNADIIYKLNMDFLTTGLDFRIKLLTTLLMGKQRTVHVVNLLLSALISQRMAKLFINVQVTTGIRVTVSLHGPTVTGMLRQASTTTARLATTT